MHRHTTFTVLVAFVALCGAGQAGVIDIVCRDGDGAPWPEELWSFDYDSHVLTIHDTIREIGPYPPGDDLDDRTRPIQVRFFVDSESTITVIKNTTNGTDLPWTSYTQKLFGAVGGVGPWFETVEEGSIHCSKLPTITFLWATSTNLITFSGPEPIASGESFAVQYDVSATRWPEDEYPYLGGFDLYAGAIPEPGSILFAGAGALTLLRKQKRR